VSSPSVVLFKLPLPKIAHVFTVLPFSNGLLSSLEVLDLHPSQVAAEREFTITQKEADFIPRLLSLKNAWIHTSSRRRIHHSLPQTCFPLATAPKRVTQTITHAHFFLARNTLSQYPNPLTTLRKNVLTTTQFIPNITHPSIAQFSPGMRFGNCPLK
jgi:hypothetical protein